MRSSPATNPPPVRVKKPLVRRHPGRTPQIRATVQVLFLLLNLWIGIEFYAFVRFYETGGTGVAPVRPPGVEGWLPIAALMNLKLWVLTGEVPVVHPAGMFLLIAFLAMSIVFRKSFCSWLCPIGTLSEWLWQGGQELFGRTFALPRWIDVPLRGLKYLLLGLFLYAIGNMSAAAIARFLMSPYGLIADVKMLDFFRDLGRTSATVIGVLLVLSVFVKNVWCRYLCPYGALMGLVALVSPARITRVPPACIDCAKCAKACPSLLPVDRLLAVRSAECTTCYSCVEVCPVEGALHLTIARRRRVPGWAVAAVVAAIFLGTVAGARWAGYWDTPIPDRMYRALIPRAHEFGHP